MGLDAVQDLRDVQRGAGLFEYVKGHIHLGQTCATAWRGGDRLALAEAAHGAELRFREVFITLKMRSLVSSFMEGSTGIRAQEKDGILMSFCQLKIM